MGLFTIFRLDSIKLSWKLSEDQPWLQNKIEAGLKWRADVRVISLERTSAHTSEMAPLLKTALQYIIAPQTEKEKQLTDNFWELMQPDVSI